jgi:hypothetical protein
MHTKLLSENLKGMDHSEDLGTDGKVIGIDLREIAWDSVDCMDLAQDRGQWCTLANMVMNLWV